MERKLSKLERMNLGELKEYWARDFEEDVPTTRAEDFLRRQLEWKLQAAVEGDLSTSTKRRLRDLAKAFEKDSGHQPIARSSVQSGMTLTRNWQGKLHTVQMRNGGYIYKEKHYLGLSKIASENSSKFGQAPKFSLQIQRIFESRNGRFGGRMGALADR
jgi:hypothetical protein